MRVHIADDTEGNTFFKVYGTQTNMCASIGDTNVVYQGTPKLTFRQSKKSKFGNELFVEFLVKKLDSTYKSNSEYDTVEIYFLLDEFFLMVQELKDKLDEVKKIEC